MGSVSHRNKHVKMCKNTDFQVYGTSGFLFVKGSPSEGWGNIPHSKIVLGAFSEWGLFFIVLSMSKCVRNVSFRWITQIVLYL